MKNYYIDRLRKEKDVLTISDVIRLTGFSKSGVLNWLSLKKLHAFRLSIHHQDKSAVQKADNVAIERLYRAAQLGGYADA